MKKHFLLIVFILSVQRSPAQSKISDFVNEISISGNTTDVKDQNTLNRYGFGIGLLHTKQKDKYYALLTGVELFYTSQFKKYEYNGHFSGYSNLTYHFINLSIKVAPRLQFGKKNKLIVEFGPILDLPLNSYYTATVSSFDPFTMKYTSENVSEKFDNSPNLDFYTGVGISHQFKKVELLLEPQYKIGNTKILDIDYLRRKYFNLTIALHLNSSR
jgi:hypothetical protein